MGEPYPKFSTITVRFDKNVAIISLCRPEQRNAFTEEMRADLVECYRRLDNDDRVKAIVLTGTPNKGNAFCAGADLSKGDFSSANRYARNSAKNLNEHRDGGGMTALAAFRVRKPVIAAINGHAVGIGITMTLTTDIRIAWQDAKIGFVFAQRGIIPEATSSYFLPKLIGHSRAMELFMTARVLPASSPTLDLLFSSLYPTPEATVAAGIALAHEIANQNSAISMAILKGLVWRGENTPEEQHLLDSKAMHVTGNGLDSKEGVLAFKEKRLVNFKATIPKDIPTEFYPWWTTNDIRPPSLAKL